MEETRGVSWPAVVALGAATFATINYLTRWLLPGVYGQIHHHHVTMVNRDPASLRL